MKKNISTFIMVAVLLFSLAMPAFASSTNATNASSSTPSVSEKVSSSASSSGDKNSITYVVSTSKLYVRSGPSASNSKLGTLAKDATVTGVDTNGWVKFTFNDKTAYCSDKYLTKANATASTSASASSSANSVINTYVVTSAKLTIRSGAGNSYSKLGYLKKGATEAGVVESGWLKFTYDGKTAYCSAKYLKEQNS
jgi:uncharacterized protein YgiM (DUF1202 family)